MKNYDALISNQESLISRCQAQNQQYKEDIEKLREAEKKLLSLLDTVEETSSTSRGRINMIPSLFTIPVKLGLFDTLLEALGGHNYQTAKSGLRDGISEIHRKIRERNDMIDANNSQISNARDNISSLRNQKAQAIRKEREKKEKAKT